MSPTRREFIKRFGIAIASLMAARCVCIPFASSGRDESSSPRDRLRSCWYRFNWLAEQAQDWDHYERGEEARDELTADHRAALDELVDAGELEADVADQVQAAFDAAAYHVWRANCGMTCYEPLSRPDYVQTGSAQLVRQAEILAELADDETFDQDAIAQAQAAIERDIAFLSLPSEEKRALYDELVEAAGEGHAFPSFDELELEITPEAAAAARFLIELLLEEQA